MAERVTAHAASGTAARQIAADRTIRDAWTVLCSALTNAVTEKLIVKNVAGMFKVSKPRKRKVKPWTVEEARRFLESAKREGDLLYAAYVSAPRARPP
jgi:integrase